MFERAVVDIYPAANPVHNTATICDGIVIKSAVIDI